MKRPKKYLRVHELIEILKNTDPMAKVLSYSLFGTNEKREIRHQNKIKNNHENLH